jgi:hypothetical protein
LDSFENQDLEVMLSINGEKTIRPLIFLAKTLIGDKNYAVLIADEDDKNQLIEED